MSSFSSSDSASCDNSPFRIPLGETIHLTPSGARAHVWRTGDPPDEAGACARELTLTPAKSNHTISVGENSVWMVLDDAEVAAEPRSYKQGVTDVLLRLDPAGRAAKAVAALDGAVKSSLLAAMGSRRFGDIFLTPASLEMVYQPSLNNGTGLRVKVSDVRLQGYVGRGNAPLTCAQAMRLLTPGRRLRVVVAPVFVYNYERRVGIHWRLKQIHSLEDPGSLDDGANSDWSL